MQVIFILMQLFILDYDKNSHKIIKINSSMRNRVKLREVIFCMNKTGYNVVWFSERKQIYLATFLICYLHD